ncbi:hypothetical protein EZS27_020011 [termite gut metagenome]|uniref:DUF3408 domain-containing protein n=1 Tax=termite gut metagenome TaxID=433724 RepID=A0A5J4RC64_9ZZZZ
MPTSKREVPGIDESFLLQSIKEQETSKDTPKKEPSTEQEEPKPETMEPVGEKPKEPVKRRRSSNVDYSAQFLQKNEFKTRQCVYISQRIHATITAIVRVIADKDVTVGGYIDNVLLQHLETHRDEINELYKKERKDLIEF